MLPRSSLPGAMPAVAGEAGTHSGEACLIVRAVLRLTRVPRIGKRIGASCLSWPWYSDLHPILNLILRQGLQMKTLVREYIHTHNTQQYIQKCRPRARLGEKAWTPGVIEVPGPKG